MIAALAVTLYVIVAPLAASRYVPMTDLPFHVAQGAAIRHYWDPSYHFHEQFVLRPIAIPYMAINALVAVAMLIFPVLLATKVALAILLMMVPGGLAVLFHGAKKSPLLGLLGLGMCWGHLTHWGFVNYVAALGEVRARMEEAIEKAQMLHEINENLQKADQWDGQGRWIGKENEEMRMGQLLQPAEFMKRLWSVIGENRVQINRYAVEGRVALLVDDPEATRSYLHTAAPAPEYDRIIRNAEARSSGEEFKKLMVKLERSFAATESARYIPPPELAGKAQVATLQWPVGTEWMVMRINEYGVPTSAKYLGWRTALLSMIMLGIITEQEAHKAFPVQATAASLWYRAQLYHWRNGGKSDA